MNHKEIYQAYCNWMEDLSLLPLPEELLEPQTIVTRELANTPTTLIGEIIWLLAVYTDKLHIFPYSEETMWLKDAAGDTEEPERSEFEYLWEI